MASRNKRQAESPLHGVDKETRDGSPVTSASSAGLSSKPSYASVVNGNRNSPEKIMGGTDQVATGPTTTKPTQGTDQSIFKTSKPQGAFRDEVVVEINTINDEPFLGTITTQEAVKAIFIKALGFSKEALGSITIGYSRGRIVTFKLKDQFDIDQLANYELFSFNRTSTKRNGETFEQKVGCKIRGIRRPNSNDAADYRDRGLRWVKIEGCEYRIEKEELKQWMEMMGNVISEITEDRVNLNLDSDSEGEDPSTGYTVGNGIYSVQMQLSSELPQYLPICGKRIRLYYRGITKMCTYCFGAHARKVCSSPKVQWIDYVREFMKKYDHIPTEYYGKWANIVSGEKRSPGGVSITKEQEVNQPIIQNVGVVPMVEDDESLERQRQSPVNNSLTTGEDGSKETEKSNVEDLAGEELGNMLSRLRSLGMDVTPTVIKKTTDIKTKENVVREEKGGRRPSLT